MDIIVDTNSQHVVAVVPGTPLDLGNGEVLNRAVATCSLCGVVCAGSALLCIEEAYAHADR